MADEKMLSLSWDRRGLMPVMVISKDVCVSPVRNGEQTGFGGHHHPTRLSGLGVVSMCGLWVSWPGPAVV